MAAVTVNIGLSPTELTTLQNTPGQIIALINTARQTLEAVRSGADTGNPFGALLGTLSTLSQQAEQLPAIDSLLAPARDLLGDLPSGALADIAEIRAAIEQVLGLLGPLKDVLLTGDLESAFQQALDTAQEAVGRLFRENDEVSQVQQGLAEFFRLFRVMLGWQTQTPRPEEVVDLLSRALVGVAPDLLHAPVVALEAALAPLGNLLPAGADLTRWREMAGQLSSFWGNITARVAAGATINWAGLEVDLQAHVRLLLELRGVRDRLLAVTLTNVSRYELRALSDVCAAIRAVPRVPPLQLTPILNGLRRQLQGVVQDLGAWNPSEEEIRALIRGVVDGLLGFLEESPLGRLRGLLIDFQQRLLRAIDSLPLRDLARDVEAALRHAAEVIDVLNPDTIRRPLREFLQRLEEPLQQISGDTIRNAIGGLWQSVEQALQQVSTQIEALRTTLQGAVSTLQTFAQNLQPALNTISLHVTTIKTALDGFDLSQPAAAVIDELHELRDTVSRIDVSSLPAPAVSAVKAGAETLRQIDLAGAITPPIDEALSVLDPATLLELVATPLQGIVEQIRQFDPASLAAQLDAPVDELLEALSSFGPEQLRRMIEVALQPVEDAIRGVDFTPVLAPLTRLYAELAAKVDSFLNPEVIFQPLEAIFQPLVDVIDGMEPSRFIKLLEPHAGNFGEHIGGAAGPPGAITSAGTMLKEAITPVADMQDELFGYRPGDMLAPLIDLHRRLMQAFDALDDTVLTPAGRLLQEALFGRLRSLDPETVMPRVQAAMGEVHVEFDPTAVVGRLREAALTYHGAISRLAERARQSLPPADAVIAARILALLPSLDPLNVVPGPEQGDSLLSATVSVEANIDLSELRACFASVRRLGGLFPGFLAAENVAAASLRQALRELDPSPLRDEINTLFDQIGQRIVGLQDQLIAALEEFFLAAEQFFLPITPGSIVQLAHRLHAALKQQALALHPAAFKDEVKLIFDVVKRQLTVFDPSVLVAELNGLRDRLIQQLHGFVDGVLPDPAPLHEMQTRLAALKPSQLLAPVTEALLPISELVATLDPRQLFEPLIEAIERVRAQTPQVIVDVEAALDEVLAAFPEGGISGGSVTVSAQASVG
jgi:hypothetical protein